MQTHFYQTQIEKAHLDALNHVNNAMYMQLYEQARWEIITSRGYGIEKIQETQLGPVILEARISFLKELRLYDKITIETKFLDYEAKVGKLFQIIKRQDEICSTADFLFGLFDMNKRQLVLPTDEWLRAVYHEIR